MGSEHGFKCRECGDAFHARQGGGFRFHLLRCDRCGEERSVEFSSLGELHLRYLKGLTRPYSTATRDFDLEVQREYPGEPLAETDYHAAVERTLRRCGCGGQFRFDAPVRCPGCQSSDVERDEGGPLVLYD